MIKAYGVAHVTLTVSDIERTKSFYENIFGGTIKNDNQFSFSLLKFGVPCWFVEWPENKGRRDRFDEKRIGLDHLAFELETISELNEVIKNLQAMKVETVGLEYFANKYPYVCFRDPDNIQVEFFISKP